MSFFKSLIAAGDKPQKSSASQPVENPWAAAAEAGGPATLHDGFDAGRRRKTFGGAAWWWAKRVGVALLLLSGFIQLVVRPVLNVISPDDAPKESTEQVSLQAAGGVASSFALDYLTSGGAAWEPHREAALSQWLYGEMFAGSDDLAAWQGDGAVLADSPSVIGTQRVGDDGAVIAVQVRVATFIPGEGAITEVDPPPVGESAQEAFRPSIPGGYVAGPSYWLRLMVPVLSDGSGAFVTAPGPVFSADDLSPIPPIGETDPKASDTLRDNAETLFNAYASADLEYVAAEGSDLKGMGGALSVAEIEQVDVAASKNSDGTVNAAAKIQWQLVGTDLRIAQTYGLRLVKATSDAPQIKHISVIEPRMTMTGCFGPMVTVWFGPT